MGFFSLLETIFFFSLAVTFVLIIMLVYHFKERLVVLEKQYTVMFEIFRGVAKELSELRELISIKDTQSSNQIPISFGGPSGIFPPEIFRAFQNNNTNYVVEQQHPFESDDDDDYDDDYDDDETNIKKIVVSDTELEHESDDDQPNVKIISVLDITPNQSEESVSLEDLEEEENIIDRLEIDSVNDESQQNDHEVFIVNKIDENTQETYIDYKKLDVSYLRTMVITRGLATDTKKMKKQDLIRLLEESQE
jgi:hypothetical protein